MDDLEQNRKFGALIPAGSRIDHDEDIHARKQRELGAAFNRMSSSDDAEAQTAFERARRLTREIGVSFDAILKAARDAAALQDVNSKLGKQLRQVMQENAKYRAMHLSYRVKGQIIQAGRASLHSLIYIAPLVAILILYQWGFSSAFGASVLVFLVGAYHAVRGILAGYHRRILIGSVIALAAVVAISVVIDRDMPGVKRRELELVENMNRDHELGPKPLYIDYPLSHLTRIATVIGITDTLKISVDGRAEPLEITCNKYYAKNMTVREDERDSAKPPEMPDIFHAIPVATFGACDLYTRLRDMR